LVSRGASGREGAPKMPCRDEVLYPDTRETFNPDRQLQSEYPTFKAPLGVGGISENPFPVNSAKGNSGPSPLAPTGQRTTTRWETRRDLRPDPRGQSLGGSGQGAAGT
jgi:hypothetical protein